jgi:carbamoyltransferase
MQSKSELLLGITSGSESGVCLFIDGLLQVAVSEERFSRIKNDDNFPHLSLKWLCEKYNLNANSSIDIAFGFSNGVNVNIAELGKRLSEYPKESLTIDFYKILFERYITEYEVDKEKVDIFLSKIKILFPESNIHFEYHHNSHRASAFFHSGLQESYVLTCDGRGDGKSLTLSKFTPEYGFEEIYYAHHWESLGYFYGRITGLCGFTPNRHEGKVTGLSAHGDPTKAKDLMNQMIYYKDGKIFSNLGSYYTPFFTNFSAELIQAASQFSREDLAAAAQAHLEEILTSLIKYHTKSNPSFNLCVAGGVFANVRLNSALKNLEGVDNFYVFPHMSDGGIPVGACYSHLFSNHKIQRSSQNRSILLGPPISHLKLESIANSARKSYLLLEDSSLVDKCIEILKSGGLLALCTGNSEYGPRALGNRSLLAIPSDSFISKKINTCLSRDEFMPLAPVMLPRKAKDLLIDFSEDDATLPYMVSTFKASEKLKSSSPAIVHIDGTCRAQILSKDQNSFLFHLLEKLDYEHSIDCLINTSFNLHEEPIVSDEQSAFNTLIKSNIEALVCPPLIIFNK